MTIRLAISGSLALVLLCLTGCDRHNKFAQVQRVSDHGQLLYAHSRKLYAEARAKDLHGPPHRQVMDQCLAHLDGAIVTDPKCPLFQGKKGEVLIDLGPDSHDRAKADLNNALKLEQNWIPAWIGLADLSTRNKDLAGAEQLLKSAETSLETLQTYQKKGPLTFYILGLNINFDKPPKLDDPKLPEETRHAMLMNWLQESEQWTMENANLLARSANGRGATVDTTNLFRRFRARIHFQRLIMSIAKGDKPAVYMPMFDRIFEWDPNFFPARIEQAHQFRKLGQYREAERILRPYMDSQDPKVAGNARLLYEMAAIYTDWYLNASESEHAEDISRLAERFFERLHEVNEQHADGWIKRAELYARSGAMTKRQAALEDARKLLENARSILQQETAEIKRVQTMIDQAHNQPK